MKNSIRFVKVRWDSGKYEAYRGGVEENCYDLRVSLAYNCLLLITFNLFGHTPYH
jgi:hypothetical protein